MNVVKVFLNNSASDISEEINKYAKDNNLNPIDVRLESEALSGQMIIAVIFKKLEVRVLRDGKGNYSENIIDS